MLTVSPKQIKNLKDDLLRKFEDSMVEHVKKYYPNHYISIQEPGVRNTIRYGYTRAQKYGFNTQRNVAMYLNNMLILGSDYDVDPQYSWAQSILKDPNEFDAAVRIDKVSDKTLDVFGKISGPHHKYLNKALLYLQNNASNLFLKFSNANLQSVLPILAEIFPKKVEVVGEENLTGLIQYGKGKANSYKITTEGNISLYVLFMFMSGAGFDKDPQFSWAGEVLTDPEINDQDEKIKLLFDKAIESLKKFLNQYKPV